MVRRPIVRHADPDVDEVLLAFLAWTADLLGQATSCFASQLIGTSPRAVSDWQSATISIVLDGAGEGGHTSTTQGAAAGYEPGLHRALDSAEKLAQLAASSDGARDTDLPTTAEACLRQLLGARGVQRAFQLSSNAPLRSGPMGAKRSRCRGSRLNGSPTFFGTASASIPLVPT